MAQIKVKQISDFPDLPTKDQVAIVYDLIKRLIAQNAITGFPINDPVLLSLLPTALNDSQNSQINIQTPIITN